MSEENPIELLFGGMAQLGPGSDEQTLQVLRRLPRREFRTIIDAGCGTGRQTLVLARELGTRIVALDTHEPFLDDLQRRAEEANLAHLIEPRLLDMQQIPEEFREIELLWSEGAAYSIGFENALATWATAIASSGLVVVSELTWLKPNPPAEVAEFFATGYPAMQAVDQNVAVAERTGYRVRTTHTLPPEAWTRGYYDILAPRARKLLDHPSASVREFAAETIREIEIFDRSEQSYGYVFFVLERAG